MAEVSQGSGPEATDERVGVLYAKKKEENEKRQGLRTTRRMSIFIRPQALTFPVVVGLVKVGWEGLQRLPISWAGQLWLPFTACLLIGLLISLEHLRVEKFSWPMRILGLTTGLLNSCVMFAAVLGISGTK